MLVIPQYSVSRRFGSASVAGSARVEEWASGTRFDDSDSRHFVRAN